MYEIFSRIVGCFEIDVEMVIGVGFEFPSILQNETNVKSSSKSTMILSHDSISIGHQFVV